MSFCCIFNLTSGAHSQEATGTQGQASIGFNFSNFGHEVNAGYSKTIQLGRGFLNYSFAAEKHTEAEYDVLSIQLSQSSNFEILEKHTLNLTFPITYDTHPTADFAHYAISPRLSLITAFESGASLVRFVEISADRGTIVEQHHFSRRVGGAISWPFKDTLLEVSSSVAHLDFKNSDDHKTFIISFSASGPISSKTDFRISTSFGEDFEKFLRNGEIYRFVTKQELLLVSINRKFEYFDLTPYFSITNLKSDVFKDKEIRIGFRANWTF